MCAKNFQKYVIKFITGIYILYIHVKFPLSSFCQIFCISHGLFLTVVVFKAVTANL